MTTVTRLVNGMIEVERDGIKALIQQPVVNGGVPPFGFNAAAAISSLPGALFPGYNPIPGGVQLSDVAASSQALPPANNAREGNGVPTGALTWNSIHGGRS